MSDTNGTPGDPVRVALALQLDALVVLALAVDTTATMLPHDPQRLAVRQAVDAMRHSARQAQRRMRQHPDGSGGGL